MNENRNEEEYKRYFEEIAEWQKKMNLMSKSEVDAGYENFVHRHVQDSLSLMKFIKKEDITSVIDIGSGAGIPAIPLAIANPSWSIVLVESRQKKALFLESVLQCLNMGNASVINERAEILAHLSAHREQYDLAIARAVGNLSETIELTLPFVRKNGHCALLRGVDDVENIDFSTNFALEIGGKLENVVEYSLKGIKNRRKVWIFQKESLTINKFPRKPGRIGTIIRKI
jgi:16S rRNA (guanine527-N7)-methyltransferase